MIGFFQSFGPFFSRFKTEVVLLSFACLLSLCSIGFFLAQEYTKQNEPPIESEIDKPSQPHPIQFMVHVSGAVLKPGIYAVSASARLGEAVTKAGGLLPEADKAYVDRNFNFARYLADQEKIYIPYLSETSEGIVLENKHIFEYMQPNILPSSYPSDFGPPVNINTATLEELDEIPGIGTVQAQSIIKARPYTQLDDLVTKKAIRQSIFTKITPYITLRDQ